MATATSPRPVRLPAAALNCAVDCTHSGDWHAMLKHIESGLGEMITAAEVDQ